MNQKEVVDGRSYSHEVLEHCRFRAIILYQQGENVNEVARFFGVHRGSVSRWITKYKRKGKNELKSKKAPGPAYKLTNEEMRELLKLFRDDATQYHFETPLWTCNRIQQVVQKRMGKKLHPTNIMRWLKRWGMTHQKPRRQATQRDEKLVKRWLREDWPKIREHRRRWQAMLYFLDESGVSLTAVLGKTWAPKGHPPVVKVTGNRGGFCVTSAISPRGKMLFRIEKGKVNAEKHIEFLERIMSHHPYRKIIVVEDRAPAHRADRVRRFVEQHRKRLAVYYLPPYAPELNPDEDVWQYLKVYQLKAHQAQTTNELKHLVKRKLQSIQRRKGLVHSFFIGTYVT